MAQRSALKERHLSNSTIPPLSECLMFLGSDFMVLFRGLVGDGPRDGNDSAPNDGRGVKFMRVDFLRFFPSSTHARRF